MTVWARADGVRQPEAAHASTNSRPTPAIRSMHAYRQQHKQKKIDQHKMGPKPEQPGDPRMQRSPGPQALRRRVRRVGAAAAHSAPARLQRCPDRAALRRCSRIRGLPDADDTPLHATDHARHAPTPSE